MQAIKQWPRLLAQHDGGDIQQQLIHQACRQERAGQGGAGFQLHFIDAACSQQAQHGIQIKTGAGKTVWGAGVDTNIELASIKAVLSAVNRA